MNSGVSNADTPNLGIRKAGQQVLRGRERIVRHLKGTCVNVDSHDLALVASLDLRAHLPLVDFRAAPGVLFFAVTWLPHCHGISPALTMNISASVTIYMRLATPPLTTELLAVDWRASSVESSCKSLRFNSKIIACGNEDFLGKISEPCMAQNAIHMPINRDDLQIESFSYKVINSLANSPGAANCTQGGAGTQTTTVALAQPPKKRAVRNILGTKVLCEPYGPFPLPVTGQFWKRQSMRASQLRQPTTSQGRENHVHYFFCSFRAPRP
jgi:hypothetical protein